MERIQVDVGKSLVLAQWKLKKSKQRGITLIALIITIIVLLILAGVTLSLTFRGKRDIYNSKRSSIRKHERNIF